MNVGKEVRRIRKKKGLSQGELASRLNVSQSYLCLVEKETKEPSLDFIKKVATEFEIPVYYLMLKGLDVDKDIKPSKRETYRQISPVIESMIERFFIDENDDES